MNELEILDYDIGGGQKIKDITALTYLQWVAKKLNNLTTYSPQMNELRMLVTNPTFGSMTPETKIEIFRKLVKAGAPL